MKILVFIILLATSISGIAKVPTNLSSNGTSKKGEDFEFSENNGKRQTHFNQQNSTLDNLQPFILDALIRYNSLKYALNWTKTSQSCLKVNSFEDELNFLSKAQTSLVNFGFSSEDSNEYFTAAREIINLCQEATQKEDDSLFFKNQTMLNKNLTIFMNFPNKIRNFASTISDF